MAPAQGTDGLPPAQEIPYPRGHIGFIRETKLEEEDTVSQVAGVRGSFLRWGLLVVVALAFIGGTSSLSQADGPVKNPGVFADVPAGHWAEQSILYLVDRGIIEGLPNGLFEGERAPSRYEMATLLARALQYVEGQLENVTLGPGPGASKVDLTNEDVQDVQIRPEDLKVLQDLIFKISDRLQQLSGEVNALKTQRPEIDPDLAERIRELEVQKEEVEQLKAQLAQSQQEIRQLKEQVTKFRVQSSTVSEAEMAKTNQQIVANRIIGIFAAVSAVVAVALATLR